MAGNYEKLSPILRGNYNNHKHFYISKYQPYGAATAPSAFIYEEKSHKRNK
jgi:outer membrane protein assembly factor BamE (lipoprotein component of BamABCDE complex)